MKREPGFYWVQFKGNLWEIAEYRISKKMSGFVGYWIVTGSEYDFNDDEFILINEQRILPPNEKQK